MKISNQQKAVIAACTALIVILSLVTVFNRPDTALRDVIDYERAAREDARLQAEYEAYLASIETDPEASQALLKKLVTEEDVRAEAEALLGLGRPVSIPSIPDSSLKISSAQGREPLLRYLKDFALAIGDLEAAANRLDGKLYVDSVPAAEIQESRDQVKQALVAVSNITVPREAVAFHKADINTLGQYLQTIELSIGYAHTKAEDWQKASDAYRIADDQLLVATREAQRLDEKYALGFVNLAAGAQPGQSNPFLIKTARAQGFSLGNITIKDVPRILEFAFRRALSQTYAKFQLRLVEIFLTKLERSYRISNFLYYTDTLVQGQYTDDYLAKYIADPDDQALTKRFIPEFVCNDIRREDLKVIFQGKAREYLGFNPATLSLNDPQYYNKRLKMGSFFADPNALAVYYDDVAAQARGEARNAAFLEQIAPGLKVSRTVDKNIETYLQKSQSYVDKLIQAPIDVGTGNAEALATIVIQGALENLINNFLFKGAVFQEQRTCVRTTIVNPVVPAKRVPDTDIHIPPEPK